MSLIYSNFRLFCEVHYMHMVHVNNLYIFNRLTDKIILSVRSFTFVFHKMSHLMTKPKKWHVPSEDSDKPGHPPSYQRRQADLSLCWLHMPHCGFVMRRPKWSWAWNGIASPWNKRKRQQHCIKNNEQMWFPCKPTHSTVSDDNTFDVLIKDTGVLAVHLQPLPPRHRGFCIALVHWTYPSQLTSP